MRHIRQSLTMANEYPMTHAIAGAMLVSAAQVAGSVGLVPTALALPIGVGAALAAILILVGLQWRGDTLNRLSLELLGQVLAAAVWLVDAVVLLAFVPGLTALVPLFFLAASASRARRLHRDRRLLLGTLKEAVRVAHERGDDS